MTDQKRIAFEGEPANQVSLLDQVAHERRRLFPIITRDNVREAIAWQTARLKELMRGAR